MVKDRTFEFRSAIDIISDSNVKSLRQASGNKNVIYNSGANEFLDKATSLSREFSKISSKLEQLNRLARNKSIFDDNTEEFEEVSNLIKRELSILNGRIQELKLKSKLKGTLSTTILEHEKNVILILQNWTAQSFKSFENILEIRSQNLKNKKDRKDQFGNDKANGIGSSNNNFLVPSFRASSPPKSFSQSESTQSPQSPQNSNSNSPLKQRPIDPSSFTFNAPQAPVTHFDYSTTTTTVNNKKFDDAHVSIDFSNQQQQQSLILEQEPLLGDSKTIRARNTALGTIESTINELGSIYQQLAHLVAEQGETVQRIDFNIEDMSVNVLGAQNQLARYLRRVNSNRFLIAKVFLAFILFIIIFKFLFF